MKLIKFLSILFLFFACNIHNSNESKEKQVENITIFHAGSVSKPLKEAADSFQKIYPNIKIYREAAGSLECIRKITELKKNCDILISSDYYLIEKLMFPNHATWNLPFATNEIVLAFSSDNKKLKIINSDNWMDVLLSKEIRFSRSDPNADPCGYRTLLLWKLAEKYYNKKGLYNKLIAKDLNYIRPKEVDLLALIESNTIDYIFIYRSVAIQHKLNYITFPDNINLGNINYENDYQKAKIEVNGKKPGEKISIYGQSILYGLTIPEKAHNKELAEIFIRFLLFDCKEIFKKNGQLPVENIEKYKNDENANIFLNHSK